MASGSANLITVGRVTTVFGVKGWVKVISHTEPGANLFAYRPWWLKTAHGVKPVEFTEFRSHGKGFVAHIKGVDDRNLAAQYAGVDIAVERDKMPALEAGEYYWHQLTGLSVISRFNGADLRLGKVVNMLETGANDVLVVAADEGSIDARERLIPYVPEQFVLAVDIAAGTLVVDWDPEF